MSFSGGGSGGGIGGALMNYVGQKFPIAGAALGAAGVHGPAPTDTSTWYQPAAGQVGDGADMPTLPDYSSQSQEGAQIKGGGLKMLLSLLGA